MRTPRRRRTSIALLACGFLALAAPACQEAAAPPNAHVIVLRGTPYERGLQHGRAFGSDIRELYTRLLQVALMPLLNQEQLSLAPILRAYTTPEYLDGRFAGRMLADSAHALADGGFIPAPYLDEMRGIADGSGMDYEQILVLNTFLDTMLAFRATAAFLSDLTRPTMAAVAFPGAADDGADNDGDGQADEAGEGLFPDWEPLARAAAVEVPTASPVVLTIEDTVLAGQTCLDAQNVEPIGSVDLRRSCVVDACVDPACGDADPLPLACVLPLDSGCLLPRMAVACFQPGCAEIVDEGCIDPPTVRILTGGRIYTRDDAEVQFRVLPPRPPKTGQAQAACGPLEITFRPAAGWPAAAEVSLVVQALDTTKVWNPAPFHARALRDERVTFTTAGYRTATGAGARPEDVPVRDDADTETVPTALAFAVRGTATSDGTTLAAHHYALVDGDVAHEHALVQVVLPPEGEGRPHVVLGWTGLVGGLSGMNADGLVFAANHSDTLDNPLIGSLIRKILTPEALEVLLVQPDLEGLAKVLKGARLLASGLPITLAAREVLAGTSTAADGLARLYRDRRTYGWNVLLADAAGGMVVAEVDAAQVPDPWEAPGTSPAPVDEDGFFFHSPDTAAAGDLDAAGHAFGSVGPDDLRMACHFVENLRDVVPQPLLGTFSPRPQRKWNGPWHRSVLTDARLGDALAARYGRLDAAGMLDLLRTPGLVDPRDSMLAAVYDPSHRVLRWSMGTVPATDGDFPTLDLAAVVAGGAP
jgi:hypothetical protein